MTHRKLTFGLACLLAVSLAQAADTATKPTSQPTPKPKPLMKDFMGINTFCDQFKPELYIPTCRMVRNYHNYTWDIGSDSSSIPPFPLSATQQTGKEKPFDWGALYGSWKKAGWTIDVSIKTEYMPKDKFKDMERDAYQYGKAFASYFGPSGEAKLVESVEIGNEPAKWDAEFYGKFFVAMAKGLRDGDPKIKILPAAVETGNPDEWSKPVDLLKGHDELYDAINFHRYALVQGWPYWSRSYPEDPNINFLEKFYEMVRWRNANAPTKEIWVTEFGYDACSRPPVEEKGQTKWMDVTDEQQAQWIVRTFLMFSAIGADRAYLYWFNDDDTQSFHLSSGITRNYEPKPSYHAMKHLYETLGEYRFSRIVTWEAGDVYIHEYVRGDDANEVVWAIWRATADPMKVDRSFDLPAKPYKAERMPLVPKASAVPVAAEPSGKYKYEVNGSPLYVWMRLNNGSNQ